MITEKILYFDSINDVLFTEIAKEIENGYTVKDFLIGEDGKLSYSQNAYNKKNFTVRLEPNVHYERG